MRRVQIYRPFRNDKPGFVDNQDVPLRIPRTNPHPLRHMALPTLISAFYILSQAFDHTASLISLPMRDVSAACPGGHPFLPPLTSPLARFVAQSPSNYPPK